MGYWPPCSQWIISDVSHLSFNTFSLRHWDSNVAVLSWLCFLTLEAMILGQNFLYCFIPRCYFSALANILIEFRYWDSSLLVRYLPCVFFCFCFCVMDCIQMPDYILTANKKMLFKDFLVWVTFFIFRILGFIWKALDFPYPWHYLVLNILSRWIA